MINDEELETLNDLYQDILVAIDVDLETGSHHFNNAASEEFSKKHKHTVAAITAMGAWIKKQEELR